MSLSTLREYTADTSQETPRDGTALLSGYSIEAVPRSVASIESFKTYLPAGTRVYIPHIPGTSFDDMLATARRIAKDGYPVMPHFCARLIKDKAMLANWINRYQGEAGVRQALLLAGDINKPCGEFHASIQLLETGLFEKAGFERLHIAGHPEGSRDIDDHKLMEALHWKAAFAQRTNAKVAITTQFCFDAKRIISWAETLQAEGINLPIHVGLVGPATLQSAIQFALTCGIGPSLKILQKRVRDMTHLLRPYAPDDMITALAAYKAENPHTNIEKVHFFPCGDLQATAIWAGKQRR